MRLLVRSAAVLLALGAAPAGFAQAVHFAPCAVNTGESATIVFPAGAVAVVDGVPLVAGDEVAVFTPGGLCAGAVVWPGGGSPVAFPVWGDDPMTTAIDGLRPEEPLRFRVWVRDRNIEAGPPPSSVEVGYQPCASPPGPCRDSGTFIPGAIFVVESLHGQAVVMGGHPAGSEGTEFRVGPLVPNPVESVGRLALALDRERPVTVEVFDALGRLVLTPFDGVWPTLRAEPLSIDARTLPAGVYVVRVRGEGVMRTLRFVRR